jgi:hypothetical protein
MREDEPAASRIAEKVTVLVGTGMAFIGTGGRSLGR